MGVGQVINNCPIDGRPWTRDAAATRSIAGCET